ncbi:MAG: hypothetical protein WDN03_08975 [Rhizomicrobium sp.]
MTVTTLDPKTAPIVIDLQKGIVGLPAVHPIGGVLAAATVLAAASRRRGLPVVLVNVMGGAPGRTERSNVTLALDAMTDLSPEAHDNAVARVFPRLGETGSAGESAGLLDRA